MKSFKVDCERRLKGDVYTTSTLKQLIANNQEVLTTSKRFTAFTLAEVLITLAVIGVVASMTIPNMIMNHEKQKIITSLKAFYSTGNQVLAKYAADKGCMNDLKCTGIFASDKTAQDLGDELAPYFNIAKNCGTVDNSGCFSNSVWQGYDGTIGPLALDEMGTYRFITSDGMAISMNTLSNNCEDDQGNETTGHMSQKCGNMRVDINGPSKGPNRFGKDIFSFLITNANGPLLYPKGGSDTDSTSRNNRWKLDDGTMNGCYSGDTSGIACAGRIIEEGWQINYF